ncbi:hypothetical protein Scep_030447 [Stephania cephalantha]|uniref:Uncharacterized protein n=1 Tax=Stephania cephalantha TaxID=152367 RepID=A0AAP0DZS7_9MAGN
MLQQLLDFLGMLGRVFSHKFGRANRAFSSPSCCYVSSNHSPATSSPANQLPPRQHARQLQRINARHMSWTCKQAHNSHRLLLAHVSLNYPRESVYLSYRDQF